MPQDIEALDQKIGIGIPPVKAEEWYVHGKDHQRALNDDGLTNCFPIREYAEMVDVHVAPYDYAKASLERLKTAAEKAKPADWESVIKQTKAVLERGENPNFAEGRWSDRDVVDYRIALDRVKDQQKTTDYYTGFPGCQDDVDMLLSGGVRFVRLHNPTDPAQSRQDMAGSMQAAIEQIRSPTGTPAELVDRFQLTIMRLQNRQKNYAAILSTEAIDRLVVAREFLAGAIHDMPEALVLAKKELSADIFQTLTTANSLPACRLISSAARPCSD